MTEEYTVVQLRRQDELTRRIQGRLKEAMLDMEQQGSAAVREVALEAAVGPADRDQP